MNRFALTCVGSIAIADKKAPDAYFRGQILAGFLVPNFESQCLQFKVKKDCGQKQIYFYNFF